MKNKKTIKLLTNIFFLVSVLDIAGIVLKIPVMEAIFKPMIMLSLMALYYFSVEKRNNWYFLALAFSFLGDVLLLEKNNLFLYGLASFLLTQLLYIKLIYSQMQESSARQKLVAVVPFAIYITVLLLILWKHLDSYRIPVIVYGISISVFGMIALLNSFVSKTGVSQVLLFGAIFFIVSDTMIALNKFYQPKAFYGAAIMITYVLAQYLIFIFMKRVRDRENKD